LTKGMQSKYNLARMQYAVIQLGARQYLAKPNAVFEVDKLSGDLKTLEVDKVLLVVDGDAVELGKPYLDKKLNFEVIGNVNKQKIRVATYKAKANYRRVIGQKRVMTQIKLVEKKEVIKK